MRRIRYFIRLLFAYVTRFKGLLLVGIIFGVVTFFAIRFIGPLFWERKTERIGVTGRFTTENLPQEITEMISSGLTKVSIDSNIEPSLAKSWESPDKGKTWIFYLKEDIKWQDGSPVTSETIKYEFSDVEIEKPDEKTIIFKLENPFSPFPAVVSQPTFKKGLLGVGDWEVNKVSLAGNVIQRLEIKKDKHKIIYIFYPTEERTKLAHKLGEVDILLNLIDPSPFDSWSTVKITGTTNKNQYVAIFYNTSDRFLSDKSLRQALSYAIDKSVFEGERAFSPIAPNSWVYNPQVKPYEYDVERASNLLEKIPEDQREELVIRLSTTPPLLSKAEKISDYWKEIGIETNVNVTSTVPTEYQAFLAIVDMPKDPDQYAMWHSTQSETNISNYENPRIDKLLEDGRLELDIEERRKIYLDFQRFLIEDSPVTFLYHPVYYTVSRK